MDFCLDKIKGRSVGLSSRLTHCYLGYRSVLYSSLRAIRRHTTKDLACIQCTTSPKNRQCVPCFTPVSSNHTMKGFKIEDVGVRQK